jgi:O-antigen ligase
MLGTAAIQMFFDTYSFGVGFDAFGEQFTKYYTLQQTIGVHEPHNITYTILAELGITGLFIFSALVFFIIRDAYENVKASKQNMDEILSISLFTSLIAYLVFYQFYGGALFDSALMLNIGLILSHKKILT